MPSCRELRSQHAACITSVMPAGVTSLAARRGRQAGHLTQVIDVIRTQAKRSAVGVCQNEKHSIDSRHFQNKNHCSEHLLQLIAAVNCAVIIEPLLRLFIFHTVDCCRCIRCC